MNLDAEKLARALRAALEVDEFIVSETRSQITRETTGASASRDEATPRVLQAQIYVDRKRGRGSANLFPAPETDLYGQIQEASTRAHSALGAIWQLPAPAAPARVSVAESTPYNSTREIVRHVLGELENATPSTVRILKATATAQHSTHRAVLSNGFDNQYTSKDFTIEATVQAHGGVPVPLHLRTRQLARLQPELEKVMERSQRRSLRDALSAAATPGQVDVVLLQSSYLPSVPSDFGIWTPLVHEASAARVRAGMSTHTPGRALLSAPARGDALSMRSEGTEPYALRSAPFSYDGQAVRNFTLAEDGMATGVSIGHRDAALGSGQANGGVRRLVIACGNNRARTLQRPTTRPLLVVHALDSVQSTARGSLYLGVASAELLSRDALGVARSTPIRSAVVCGNLQDWLHDAYFSAESRDDDWILGPQLLRFNNVRMH